MTSDLAGVRVTSRLLLGALLSTALASCDERSPPDDPLYRLCQVAWRGTVMTDSDSFSVRACWNRQCSSNIPVQLVQNDGGAPRVFRDAGCFPTTPGGLPSGCAVVPITPPPGCTAGEINTSFSVLACARAGREGTAFNISLEATSPGFPDDGDPVGVRIETTAGSELVDATATVKSKDLATDGSSGCAGGLFGLDGAPIE